MTNVRWFRLAALFVFGALPLFAQVETEPADTTARAQRGPFGEFEFPQPSFQYEVYNLTAPDPNLSRLDVCLAFVNDLLQFIKQSDSRYVAHYEVNVEALDAKGNRIDGKLWQDSIVVATFEETNSREATHHHIVSFVLAPGKYKVFLELTDLDTKKHLVRQKEVTLKNFATSKVQFSDILFAEAVEFDATGLRHLVPNFSKTYSDPASPLLAYFEVITPAVRDTITFRFTIFDSENQTVTSDTKAARLRRAASVYRDTLNLSRRVTEPGQYVLALQAGEGRDQALVRETFTIQWSPNPVAVPDVDLAIEQLRYIARSSELDEMKKATQAERRKLFEEFWKKRDPTPDTPENELFLEYYRRVDYANRHFSVYPTRKDGWLTDRGRIYIIYGPPTDVERRAADLNTPAYELWYYRHLERRFIFEDRSGLGEYQLVRAE